jgi:two-component system chemotaxis response regulator CheB
MPITTTKPRVVVADDSALMRRIVSNLLLKGGVDVVGAAKDGDEALALCERERPDAMTLDLAMPGLGGIDVLKALRQSGRMIPVVVVSAFSPAHGARAVDALAEGAFELVPKPAGSGDVGVFEHNLLSKILLAARTRSASLRVRPAAPVRPPTLAPVPRAVNGDEAHQAHQAPPPPPPPPGPGGPAPPPG